MASSVGMGGRLYGAYEDVWENATYLAERIPDVSVDSVISAVDRWVDERQEARAGPSLFQAYNHAWRTARLSDSYAEKELFLDWYNETCAPKLRTEEAALQALAQNIAYLHLRPGARVDCHIQRSVRGRDIPPERYAQHYLLSQVLAFDGCVSFMFEPNRPAIDPGAALLVFRGSVMIQDGINAQSRHGQGSRGWATDFSRGGVGKDAIQPALETLALQVQEALKAHGRVVILGHSLGAALSGYLAEHLTEMFTPGQLGRIELVLYQATPIDFSSKHTPAGRTGVARVRICQGTHDVVTKGGRHYPRDIQGRRSFLKWRQSVAQSIAELGTNHARPWLVEKELSGEDLADLMAENEDVYARDARALSTQLLSSVLSRARSAAGGVAGPVLRRCGFQ